MHRKIPRSPTKVENARASRRLANDCALYDHLSTIPGQSPSLNDLPRRLAVSQFSAYQEDKVQFAADRSARPRETFLGHLHPRYQAVDGYDLEVGVSGPDLQRVHV